MSVFLAIFLLAERSFHTQKVNYATENGVRNCYTFLIPDALVL